MERFQSSRRISESNIMTNEQWVEEKKDELYALLHEFNRQMNHTGEKDPLERRAIKNKFVDEIFAFIHQSEQRFAERLREKIKARERVGKKMKCNCSGAVDGTTCVAFEDGYNESNSEVFTLITSELEKK